MNADAQHNTEARLRASARAAASGRLVAVSVILPVYNAAPTVERAIRSALGQTLADLEIIAYDDASEDDSVAALERIAAEDTRIRILRGAANLGPAAARNQAMAAAHGDWIAVLDADDWYAPERLSELLGLGARTGADFLVDNQYLYDAGKGFTIGTGLAARNTFAPFTLDDLLRNSLTGRAAYDYGLLQPVIRREFLLRHGIRYPENCRFGEDFLLALDCFAAGARGVLSFRPMYYVTQPHGGWSGTMSRPDRKCYDYAAMRRFNDMALTRYRERMTRLQIHLLQRRSLSMERYAHYVQLTAGSRRRPWRLAATLARPSLWPYLGRSLRRGGQALLALLSCWSLP